MRFSSRLQTPQILAFDRAIARLGLLHRGQTGGSLLDCIESLHHGFKPNVFVSLPSKAFFACRQGGEGGEGHTALVSALLAEPIAPLALPIPSGEPFESLRVFDQLCGHLWLVVPGDLRRFGAEVFGNPPRDTTISPRLRRAVSPIP